jgi:hypothetical protein
MMATPKGVSKRNARPRGIQHSRDQPRCAHGDQHRDLGVLRHGAPRTQAASDEVRPQDARLMSSRNIS